MRRFLPTPIDEAMVWRILNAAARAPSGFNMQPWLVHVVSGDTRARLSAAARAAAQAGEVSLEYSYLPDPIEEPYRARRRKLGYDLYALQGIEKHDRCAREAAMLRNYDFFGAPVGLFFTMDRCMSVGAWLDCGMFMQNVMILARSFGLETCSQQAWCDLGAVVRRELAIPEQHVLLSGMSLGYVDPDAAENGLVSERAPPEGFVKWRR